MSSRLRQAKLTNQHKESTDTPWQKRTEVFTIQKAHQPVHTHTRNTRRPKNNLITTGCALTCSEPINQLTLFRTGAPTGVVGAN